jgi:hypothetical protein
MDRSETDELNRFVSGVERNLRLLVNKMPPLLRRLVARAVKLVSRPRNAQPSAPQAIANPRHPVRPTIVMAHQPPAPEFNARAGALELLCAAGTLKACPTHGGHYLASGDLAAAHRLSAKRLASARYFDEGRDIQATDAKIDSVFEEISRFYHRCEDCHRARIARAVGT